MLTKPLGPLRVTDYPIGMAIGDGSNGGTVHGGQLRVERSSKKKKGDLSGVGQGTE